MNTVTDINVLDRLVVVNLDVHIWSASRKLNAADLGNPNLPPDELASLGSKRVCNPEELMIFKTLKARATSLLERTGIRFLNGWAIADDKLADIDTGLSEIKADFNTAKDQFLKRYEQSVQDWIAKHPGWEEIIANSVVSEDYVRSRIDFRWQVFRVSAPNADTELADNLDSDVKNLGNALYDEIARAATETWKNCYEGKAEVTRKALSPLKTMYDKLMGLSFVEPRATSIASLIETALDNIPARGPITGVTLLMLQGLVAWLRNPEEIVAHGQKVLEGQSANDVLQLLGAKQSKPAPKSKHASSRKNPDPVYPIGKVSVIESGGLW